MKNKKILMIGFTVVLSIGLLAGIGYYFQNRTIYELELPNAGLVESVSLKKNSDSQIVISDKDDVENILNILKDTKPTAKRGRIGVPVRVENIINVDFNSKERVISRLFLYEDKGKYFIEQTDNGVYTISKKEYDLIENYIRGN